MIYYFRDLNMPLYLLAVYAKNEKLDLTAREKRQMRDAVDVIVVAYSERWFGRQRSAAS